MTTLGIIHYKPAPTIRRFFEDRQSLVKGVMGPFGSGKSAGCAITLMDMSMSQPPDKDGWRRTRNVIVRNTYRELLDTTMQDVFLPTGWFPKDEPTVGAFWHASDLIWEIKDPVNKFQTEWLFRALDRPDHIRKLLSLSLTHAWVNEAREVGKPIIDGILGRLGRYPRMQDYGWTTDPEQVAELVQSGRIPQVGEDIPYWYGLIMDTNPPDEDHWWYTYFEETRPKGWKLYRQAGARSLGAENLENLHPLYYHHLAQGKSPDWIKVYIDAEYGFVQDGKPVYPEFQDNVHTMQNVIEPFEGLPVKIGADTSGLTPAAVYLQQYEDTWVALDETVATRLGPGNFAKEVKRKCATVFRKCPIEQGWGDPAGKQGEGETDSYFEALHDANLPFDPVATNDEVRRRESVASCLTSISRYGRPRLKISPRCRYLRKGLAGAFKYRRLAVTGEERYHDKRDKNMYSHPCEALEYGLLGEGEGDYFVGTGPQNIDQQVRQWYDQTKWRDRKLEYGELR